MSDVITIDGTDIHPGQNKLIGLQVARLPSGTQIDIQVHVMRGENPGPTILLLGGLHGDEINGVEIVRRTVRGQTLKKLKRGTVIAIPLLNVFGFINFSRAVPDGKDVNRSFPGSASGSLAARVAYVLTKKILPIIDFGIDFHTGGATIYNYPQLRITQGDKKAEKIARSFNAPLVLKNKVISKSLRKQALDMGKSILVFEGGESLRIDEKSIKIGMRGIRKVLVSQRMIDLKTTRVKSRSFTNSKWLRAPQAGVFTLSKVAGMDVLKGDLLGEIHNIDGRKPKSVFAPIDGLILSHVNNPVISRGDALFHLVY